MACERFEWNCPFPENDEPCISANLRGDNAASFRNVETVSGETAVNGSAFSRASAGPTMSFSVSGGTSPR